MRILVKPANSPATPPDKTTTHNGFFNFIVTPYNAGSVIPNSAVVAAEKAVVFITLSFVFNPTAKDAPACAMFDANIPGPNNVPYPSVAY